MKHSFYEKEFLFVIRIISIICVVFLSIVELENIHNYPIITLENSINYFSVLTAIENISVVILFILLIVYPHRLEFLSISSFIYSFECIVFEENNPMGFCMFFLGMVALYIRGFFVFKEKLKMITSTIILLCMIILRLHFGKQFFFNTLSENIAYPLVLGITLLLLKKNSQSIRDSITNRILNLADYPSLNENDVPLLQKVLENKQYKIISAELFRTEGTIRNRLNKIYDILGVMDKTGFITTYAGYDIVFDKDKKDWNQLSSIKKKKKKKK